MDEAEHDDEQCTCLPEGAIITGELRVVSYMSADGEQWKADLSHDGSGGPLDPDQVNAMAEWVKQVNSVPMLAALMHEMFCQEEGEE